MVMIARPAFARVNKQWINEYKSKTNRKGDEKKNNAKTSKQHKNNINYEYYKNIYM